MSSNVSDHWLVIETRQALTAFTNQLRSGVDGAAKIPNLEWTVADLGAHLACLPSLYRRLHEQGTTFETPDDFATFSDATRAHITETDPAALADLIEAELGSFLDEIDDLDEPRWLYARETTAGNICAAFLSEAILHGRDLAAVTGATMPTFTRQQANAIVHAMSFITPAFIDRNKASQLPDGVYHVKFRGGNDYTWRLNAGEFSIEQGKPSKADAHLNADPAAFVMSSLGRLSDARAALTGAMFTYGRKPWRFLGLGKLAADGI